MGRPDWWYHCGANGQSAQIGTDCEIVFGVRARNGECERVLGQCTHSMRRPQRSLVRQCEIGCALALQESERSPKQHSAALASRQKSLWNEEVQQRSRCYAAQSHRSSLLDRQKLKANSSRLIWVICLLHRSTSTCPRPRCSSCSANAASAQRYQDTTARKGKRGVCSTPTWQMSFGCAVMCCRSSSLSSS